MERETDRESLVMEIKTLLISVLGSPIDPGAIGEDEPLFENGIIVGSMAAIEILTALEDRFGVEFPDESINASLFFSVRPLADAVCALLPKPGLPDVYKDPEHV